MGDTRTELKFHHSAVSVPSLEESVAWWGATLGFEVEQYIDIDVIPARVAMLRRGPMRVELFEVPEASALPDERRDMNGDLHVHGNKHVAFAVADADRMAAELKARGADIVLARRAPWGAFVFIRDNVGNLIEFVEQPDLFAAGGA